MASSSETIHEQPKIENPQNRNGRLVNEVSTSNVVTPIYSRNVLDTSSSDENCDVIDNSSNTVGSYFLVISDYFVLFMKIDMKDSKG